MRKAPNLDSNRHHIYFMMQKFEPQKNVVNRFGIEKCNKLHLHTTIDNFINLQNKYR